MLGRNKSRVAVKLCNVFVLLVCHLFLLGCPKDPRKTPGTGSEIAFLVLTDGLKTAAEYYESDYGTVYPNETKSTTFTIQNTGAEKATEIVLGTLPGTITRTGGTCTSEVSAGGTCTLILSYSPTQSIDLSANFEIEYSSNYNRGKVFISTIHLSGQDGSFLAPEIDSVSPEYGTILGGGTITLSGPFFGAGSTVTVGGTACSGVSISASQDSLTCTYAAHASGLVNIVVTSPYGLTGTLSQTFNYHEVPVVSSINYPAGALAGGTSVTITGSYFASGATVSIGGSSCSSVNVVSSTQITCVTGSNSAGVKSVVVTNPDGFSGTLSNAYTYQAAPTISSINVSAGALSGGTAISITGTGFLSGATVLIGGTSATSVVVNSSTSISCVTPAHAAGLVSIVVTNTDSQFGTGSNLYTYQVAPTVTSVSPTAGALAGSTSITIAGTGFLTGATVTVGGVTCSSVSVNSATSITCTTGAHAAAVTSIVVTNTDTQAGTGTNLYTYQAAPTVTSVSPTAGALAGGSTLTITGTGFLTGATVAIGGTTCTSPTVGSATSITCTLPSKSAGAYSVSVTNSDTQNGSLSSAYTYQPAPTVTSLSPSTGSVAGGTSVTITGTGFVSGATVTIGGATCTSPSVSSSTSMSCTTPATSSTYGGAMDVVVANSDAQSGSLANGFLYDPESWTTLTTTNGPTWHEHTLTHWIGSKIFIMGGNSSIQRNMGELYDPVTGTSTFATTTNAPLGARPQSGVWTGNKMVVWGGYNSGNLNTGAIYDPVANSWTTMTTTNAPTPRDGPSLVWTGNKMIAFGGVASSNDNEGGIYDPENNSWVKMSTTNAPVSVSKHILGVWTGTYYINYNKRYKLETDTWLDNSTTNAGSFTDSAIVWTGKYVITWGGTGNNIGGMYNPITDTWSLTSTTNAPVSRTTAIYAWTGGRMIIWGGYDSGNNFLNTGGLFDPDTNSWVTTTTAGAPPGRRYPVNGVWTGSKFFVWGGNDYSGGPATLVGGLYTPPALQNSNTWTAMTTSGAPAERDQYSAVWNGSKMLVWGGLGPARMNSGGQFDPVANSWTTISTTNAPESRYAHTIHWTGSRMLIWGGSSTTTSVNTGGSYDPVSNTWDSIATTDAPIGRAGFASVWTGTKMLVWSGSDATSNLLNDGFAYNLTTNTWSTISTTNAPSSRNCNKTVWTGSKMIIWSGGGSAGTSGGMFDLENNSWSAITTVGSPAGRSYDPLILWTGSKMLIWSGYPGAYSNSGGLYDPVANSWMTMSTTDAPAIRYYPVGVWTGARLVVWGSSSGSNLNSGGIYDPGTNSWVSTSTSNAPIGRRLHQAVWTGSRMLIWGGFESSRVNTGWAYTP